MDEIDLKYANKVILGTGLCVSLCDFLDIGDSYVHLAEGAVHYKVIFRLIVFNPAYNELLNSVVTQCVQEGIRASVRFFDNILMPQHVLQSPSKFDKTTNTWIWTYADEEEEEDEGGRKKKIKMMEEKMLRKQK